MTDRKLKNDELRDQQAVEHKRPDELYRSGGGVARRIPYGLFVFVIILLGSQFLWSTLKRDYTIRAEVSEGINLAYRVRTAVRAYVEAHGELPGGNEDAGLPLASEINGKYVRQVGIAGGEIAILYGKNADTSIVGKTIVIVPDISNQPDVSWKCSSPDIPDKWLTSECRSN